MMRLLKRLVPLVFAVILGIGAVAMVSLDRQKLVRAVEAERQKLLAQYPSPIQVIVAKQDIDKGEQIQSKQLKLRGIPEPFIQPYATSHAGDLLGQIALAPIAEGEQVLRNKVSAAPKFAELMLSNVTPEEKRAVTIGMDALTGVGGFVRPGNKVDVLWTVQLPEEQGGGTVTIMLFQGTDVLAVGNAIVGGPSGGTQGQNYTVTLALTPVETSVLLYAREQGKIQLSLRPQTDRGTQVAVAPTNYLTVMQMVLGIEDDVSEPEPQRVVEVFKGLERSLYAISE